MADRWIVITTINPPTATMRKIASLCQRGWQAVVVGDTKTPVDWHCPGITFLDVNRQRGLFGDLADALPYRHYCRKNLGYLYALRAGADMILETDDDNIPYDDFGCDVSRRVAGRLVRGPGWVNVYRHFTSADVWPRGLPLDAIDRAGTVGPVGRPRTCPIQQYLADNDPDVDAVYRLTRTGSVFFDRAAPPLVLARGTWSPFNSQNTVFFREAFPLLYLPCHVSFRMTDIWRSFVAQAALHRHGEAIAFHRPTVEQVRNAHDLMADFSDEVDGYLRNREIMETLRNTATGARPADLAETAKVLWRALAVAGVIPREELPIITEWFRAVQSTRMRRAA